MGASALMNVESYAQKKINEIRTVRTNKTR